jgi:hypothetical protein
MDGNVMGTKYKVGEAPWEKGAAKSTFKLGEAPWEKEPAVVDEMHPDISFKDRAIYKNFAVDPEAGFNYLQKQYPGLNLKKDEKGDILAKRPEEAAWKKLDPSGFDLQDITDVAWDVPVGIVEGAATAAGGLLGGAAGLPAGGVGAVPGALLGGAAAGAATGAGLETARQGIGKMIGVADEFDPSQIGTSAAFGAASPLLFGTGGVAKAGVKTLGKELTEEGAKLLQKSQRGALGAGFDFAKQNVAPFLGEAASGVDRDVLRWASEPQNLAKIREAESNVSSVEIFKDLSDKFIDSAKEQRRSIGEELGSKLKMVKGEVDFTSAAKPFDDLLAKYEKRALQLDTPAAYADYDFIEKTLKEYLPEGRKLEASSAFSLKDSLNDISGIRKSPSAGIDTRAFTQSAVEKDLERTAKTAAANLDETIAKAAGEVGGEVKALHKKYADSVQDVKLTNQMFKDEATTERSLKQLVTSGGITKRKSVHELSKRLGIPVDDAAKEAVAISALAKGSPFAISSKGAVSTAKSMGAAGLGGIIGYNIGTGSNLPGGGYTGAGVGAGLGALMGGPTAMKQYMRANAAANRTGRSIQRALPAVTGLPGSTAQTGINVWQQMLENKR